MQVRKEGEPGIKYRSFAQGQAYASIMCAAPTFLMFYVYYITIFIFYPGVHHWIEGCLLSVQGSTVHSDWQQEVMLYSLTS